jgi:hypothetical protein
MLFGIDYDLAPSINADRLKEAEKWRQMKMIETTSATKPKKKWSLSFWLNRSAALKIGLANSK